MFSEAQLYENMNRIVKLLDYSPVGFQTSTLSFQCSAENFLQGLYTIPRYSYILTNNIPFSINEDITFLKTLDLTTESLNELAQQKLLYQGLYQEYPVYTAAGDDNEIIVVNVGDELVDHFNIDVYVKPKLTGKWEQYTKTLNLFLENGFAKKYEIRLNQNYRYEIKFGNDINGLKLQTGDEVAVYYLASLGSQGVIGPNALNDNARLVRKTTPQFLQILTDLSENQVQYLPNSDLVKNFIFSNNSSSTPIKEPETVDQIRESASSSYRSQYRLVTTQDYTTFIQTNFANLNNAPTMQSAAGTTQAGGQPNVTTTTNAPVNVVVNAQGGNDIAAAVGTAVENAIPIIIDKVKVALGCTRSTFTQTNFIYCSTNL
jgi:hypothetical protein